MNRLLNFIIKYISPNKLMAPVSTEETVIPEIKISEPIYAIEKATQGSIKRWKFTFDYNSFAIEDKITKRIFPIGMSFGLYHLYRYPVLTKDTYVKQLDLAYFRAGIYDYLLRQSEGILTDEGIGFALSGYDKIFNEQERQYLSECFRKLCLRKLEQANRVFEYKSHKNKLKEQKQEWLSIKQGEETRIKMLEEYQEDA